MEGRRKETGIVAGQDFRNCTMADKISPPHRRSQLKLPNFVRHGTQICQTCFSRLQAPGCGMGGCGGCEHRFVRHVSLGLRLQGLVWGDAGDANTDLSDMCL